VVGDEMPFRPLAGMAGSAQATDSDVGASVSGVRATRARQAGPLGTDRLTGGDTKRAGTLFPVGSGAGASLGVPGYLRGRSLAK